MSYKRICLNERIEIFKGLYQQRMNPSEIAVKLNRSVSAITREIVLSLKAVDVATGDVLDGRVVKAPLAKIFDMANQAALAMAVVISGGRTGLLSVSSTPDGADLYIDGMLVGQTPVVEYKIAEGSHRLMTAKRGYLDAETTVTALAGRHERWSPYLVQEQVKDRSGIELAAFYFVPTYKELDPAPYFVAAYGRTFDRFFLSGEIGYSSIDHNQTYDTLFGEVTQERFYTLFTLQGHLSYAPFPRLEKVQPYAGLFAGWGILTDFRKIATAEDDDEKLGQEDLFNLGLEAGVVLFPYSRFNLFLEGRFFWTPKEVTRIVYESQGILGDVVPRETQYYFNAFILGGGLRYFF